MCYVQNDWMANREDDRYSSNVIFHEFMQRQFKARRLNRPDDEGLRITLRARLHIRSTQVYKKMYIIIETVIKVNICLSVLSILVNIHYLRV